METIIGLFKKFRSRQVLATISILTASAFLSGEFFNCCFINHAFAVKIEKIIASLNPAVAISTVIVELDDEDYHSTCHGQSGTSINSSDQVISPMSINLVTTALASNSGAMGTEGHCISEQSITQQSMVGNLNFTWELPTEQMSFIVEPIFLPLYFVTHPPFQNKSSPPLFLRTLQILV